MPKLRTYARQPSKRGDAKTPGPHHDGMSPSSTTKHVRKGVRTGRRSLMPAIYDRTLAASRT